MYDTEGNQHLWTCMPGGEPVPIPGTIGHGAQGGRWSPDGRVIAFSVWGDGIFLINPDGSGRREIADWVEGEIFGRADLVGRWHEDRGLRHAPGRRRARRSRSRSSIRVGGSTRIETGLDHVWDWLADGTFIGGAWRYVVARETHRRGTWRSRLQAPDGTRTFLTDTPTI